MQNTDQVWYEVLLSPETDVRVYADTNFLVLAAYTSAESSELVIKEDLIHESNAGN
jgi:hypothetical protein